MTETGPCPAFKQIGDKYGPFDLAMIPIWRGGSLSFIAAAGLRVTFAIVGILNSCSCHLFVVDRKYRAP
jgi:hypothetical protein